jgi:hypothetical protein
MNRGAEKSGYLHPVIEKPKIVIFMTGSKILIAFIP